MLKNTECKFSRVEPKLKDVEAKKLTHTAALDKCSKSHFKKVFKLTEDGTVGAAQKQHGNFNSIITPH